MFAAHAETASASKPVESSRLVAWIDGVGTFLLCGGGSVRIGGLSREAEIRVVANLNRDHAAIHRSGEGYVVEANGSALVATDAPRRGSGSGRIVTDATNLADGAELVLYQEHSPAVRFRFRLPNALTSTGLLSVASEHRTEPRFDGIVLLAEACLLGPGTDAHIRCRQWPATLVLFRREGRLLCKSNTPSVPISGTCEGVAVHAVEGAIPLESGIHVTGPGISFRLEGNM